MPASDSETNFMLPASHRSTNVSCVLVPVLLPIWIDSPQIAVTPLGSTGFPLQSGSTNVRGCHHSNVAEHPVVKLICDMDSTKKVDIVVVVLVTSFRHCKRYLIRILLLSNNSRLTLILA